MWRIKTLPLSHRRRRRMNVYASLDRRVINLCRGISEMRSRNNKKSAILPSFRNGTLKIIC